MLQGYLKNCSEDASSNSYHRREHWCREDNTYAKVWKDPIWWRWGSNQGRTYICKRVSKFFYGNDLINLMEHFYKNPTDNVFIFQNYVPDVYQQRMETLEIIQHPCKVIVMDCGLDACQIFITLNKNQHTKFGILYLTEKCLWLKSKFFPGKLYTINLVVYLDIDPQRQWNM